ncbi:hypothetical protein ACCO45_001452 [Purpureocillium lilacinum]|uniref:Uncharacterized protein n=1 Tax=Purpureocillium lilacinum TaxID=33203 RepID=A0ACC4EA98_PURLI
MWDPWCRLDAGWMRAQENWAGWMDDWDGRGLGAETRSWPRENVCLAAAADNAIPHPTYLPSRLARSVSVPGPPPAVCRAGAGEAPTSRRPGDLPPRAVPTGPLTLALGAGGPIARAVPPPSSPSPFGHHLSPVAAIRPASDNSTATSASAGASSRRRPPTFICFRIIKHSR